VVNIWALVEGGFVMVVWVLQEGEEIVVRGGFVVEIWKRSGFHFWL
jgi:hypothetical protein